MQKQRQVDLWRLLQSKVNILVLCKGFKNIDSNVVYGCENDLSRLFERSIYLILICSEDARELSEIFENSSVKILEGANKHDWN